jgi:hypothetical protein
MNSTASVALYASGVMKTESELSESRLPGGGGGGGNGGSSFSPILLWFIYHKQK